jgi:hypothetical protein
MGGSRGGWEDLLIMLGIVTTAALSILLLGVGGFLLFSGTW